MSDAVIIGGGIIGMLTARELLGQGASVVLIDKSSLGQEASWAGGGIVSPLYPWTYSAPVTALASWAQNFYPALVEALYHETGINPELNPSGLLMLDPPQVDRVQSWSAENNKALSVWGREHCLHHEPNLSAEFEQGYWFPHIGNVRNPRLLQALRASLEDNKQCTIVTDAEVQNVDRMSDGRAEVRAADQVYGADAVIICTGAWANKLCTAAAVSIPVEPVQGQMLIFEPCPKLISAIVLHKGKYLIPRLDGRILVGSTIEHVGFDKSTTADAKQLLLSHAYNMVEKLQGVAVEAHWAGLRPGSPQGIPFIGKLPGWSNLFVNAGHFRNGLVLAPASARLMRNIILNETPIVDPEPYTLETPRANAAMH